MDTLNPEKDASEDELERIVFGDNSGFLANLKQFETAQSQQLAVRPDSESEAEDDGLANVADADVG
jgi:U3 small nucleolar RNA-associated protein 18